MRTIVRAFLLGLGLVFFHAAGFSQQVAKKINYPASPDGVIGFLEFRPSDYGSQKHPLIIFLHGIGERGNGTSQINSISANAIPKYCAAGATMRFTVGGQTSSFVVLSPQLSVQYGYWPTYYVKEMIAYAKANLQIDPNRIYITGLSLGGGGVWRVATDSENWDYSFDAGIAAIAPVCGTQEENDANFCNTIGANHLPIWAFHSMDDGTVGVGATQHAELLAKWCGVSPTAKFTYYQSGGHYGAWANAYDTGHITRTVDGGGSFTASPNLYEWFLTNTRSTTPAYTAPVASAGNAQSITLPLSAVTLSGSGYGTNGATIVSYRWNQTSGPAGGTINLPLLNTTLVTGLVQGTYVFTLTVTDNHGLSAYSNVTITVNPSFLVPPPPPNQTPTAVAGVNNSSITLPSNSVTLDGSGSKDPDGYLTSYKWTQTAGPAGATISSPISTSTSVTGMGAGYYTFVLEITDNGGLKAYSSINVTVNPDNGGTSNNGPQVPYADAGPNPTITLPTSSVTIDGSASKDPDGYIAAYRWTQTAGNGGASMANRDAASTSVTGLTEGSYTFILEVTDNSGLKAYAKTVVTVNAQAQAPPPPSGTLLGYIKITTGPSQGCEDASTDGRIAIYGSGISNGNILYTDAALSNRFNGGWNWYSFTPVLGGAVTYSFAVYPNGALNLLNACVAAPAPPPPPPPAGNLLGYIKMSTGPNMACADASTAGRIPIYGTSIANGSYVYSDEAMTQKYDGGWNWFSFTPVYGGAVTQAFAIYPIGSIGLLTNCNSGARMMSDARQSAVPALSANAPAAAVIAGNSEVVVTGKLSMYPNPVRSSATIQFSSPDNSLKTISLYNANGVLTAKYNWPTVRGNNVYSLNNVAGLAKGLYIADIRDTNGKTIGKLKFIKM
jgi:poly(3-hydroxybutyrate) depolymerase